MAVALNTGFYETWPTLEEVADADLALFVYDLVLDPGQNRHTLTLHMTVYTKYDPSWGRIMKTEAANEADFLAGIQTRLEAGGVE